VSVIEAKERENTRASMIEPTEHGGGKADNKHASDEPGDDCDWEVFTFITLRSQFNLQATVTAVQRLIGKTWRNEA
jgi:hypothetical protein